MYKHLADPIQESELVITPAGKVYHLNISADQLADTIITVGDPNRVKEVSKYFDVVTDQAQHREFITHTGFIGKKRITVVSSGIGPDNIDIVMNELDALANIDFKTRTINEDKKSLTIIRMGTCGSLQPDAPVDSLIVSSYGIGLDNLMLYYKHSNKPAESYILNEFIRHTGMNSKNIFPYIAEGSIALRNHFMHGYTHGITATCPGFYGPQGRMLRAPISFPNLIDALSTFRCNDDRIVNFEMETSAIYGLGNILGHKCMSINTVVANRANKTFSKDSAGAVDNMIKRSLEIIAGI